jgi:hypothetical protein
MAFCCLERPEWSPDWVGSPDGGAEEARIIEIASRLRFWIGSVSINLSDRIIAAVIAQTPASSNTVLRMGSAVIAGGHPA